MQLCIFSKISKWESIIFGAPKPCENFYPHQFGSKEPLFLRSEAVWNLHRNDIWEASYFLHTEGVQKILTIIFYKCGCLCRNNIWEVLNFCKPKSKHVFTTLRSHYKTYIRLLQTQEYQSWHAHLKDNWQCAENTALFLIQIYLNTYLYMIFPTLRLSEDRVSFFKTELSPRTLCLQVIRSQFDVTFFFLPMYS